MKNISNKLSSIVLLTACLGSFSNSASAVDGVILITQANAQAGNVTPGDTAGFPVTISRSGSYRLASNLDVPIGKNGIEIETGSSVNADLDLNGFEISGKNRCIGGVVGAPVSCTFTGEDIGVKNISVKNGTIKGFGSDGVYIAGVTGSIENIVAVSNGRTGIACGEDCKVSHSSALLNLENGISISSGIVESSTSARNGFDGISINSNGTVVNSEARSNGYNATTFGTGNGIDIAGGTVIGCATDGNKHVGIDARSNSVLTNNTSHGNGEYGIFASDGQISGNAVEQNGNAGIVVGASGVVTGNTARDNNKQGLSFFSQYVGYSNNVLFNNNSNGSQISGGVSLGQNLCNGTLCP